MPDAAPSPELEPIEPPGAGKQISLDVPEPGNAEMAGMVSARFRAGMRPLALGTALVVALAAPIADFLLERGDLAERGEAYATELGPLAGNLEAATHAISRGDGEAAQRLIDSAVQRRPSPEVVKVVLWGDHGNLLAQSSVPLSKPVWPLVWSAVPIALRGAPPFAVVQVAMSSPELVERDSLLLAMFGALGLVLGVALYYFPLRLFREEDLIILFSRRSIRAAEEERIRLSRELHDGMGQTLGAAAVALARVQARLGPTPEAAETARLIDRGLDELRHLSLGLRPPSLDDLGLGPAVHALAREAEAAGIAGTVKIGELPRLDEEIELACFRLAQEGLSNLVQHSGARTFSLSLAKTQESLVLEIEDDGKGFAPSSVSGLGLGLVGARERAARLAGTFSVESAPGKGARLRAVLPVKA